MRLIQRKDACLIRCPQDLDLRFAQKHKTTMTTNPSTTNSHRQRYLMGTSSAARRAATRIAVFLLLLTISAITAESNINNGGDGIDDINTQKDASATTHQNEPSSVESSSSSTNRVHIDNGPIPPPPNDDDSNSDDKSSSQQPTANILPNDENDSTSSRIIQSFNTLFTPQIEEYTLTKFDPYSFSGAPLGGWGRATRSRLASLPIRLVSDYGGGLELGRPSTEDFFERGCVEFGRFVVVDDNGSGSGEEVCVLSKEGLKQMETIQEYVNVWGLTEEMLDVIWSGAPKVNHYSSNNNNNEQEEEEETIGLEGFLQIFDQFDALYTNGGEVGDDPWESNGPHFTLRDGMGRQFVCRVYDEGELEVDSYMNSMFSPAVKLGYSNVIYGDNGDGEGSGRGVKKNTKEEEEEDDEDMMNVMTPIAMDTVIIDGVVDGNVAEALTSEIRNLLEEMALDGQLEGEDIVIDIDAAVVDNQEISDIVRAAIQGAGLNKDGAAKGSSSPPSSPNAKPLSTQLTKDQIFDAWEQLRGFCSQLHIGWWSYEWCHDYQVRQFHVDVSPDPTAADGHKYKIVDVTTIGHYQGITEIVNPRGIYDGEVKKGLSVAYDLGDDNKMKELSRLVHGPKEDEEYSKPFYDREKDMKTVMPNRLKNELQKFKTAQYERLGNSGGIVKQHFAHGDMCDEVGILREVDVEYRCCTGEEITHWLNAKRKPTDAKTDEVPRAVLVSVQEDETCVYRAKVCTPLLCPEALLQAEVAPSPNTPVKPAPKHDTNDVNQVGTALGHEEALEAVYRSLNEEGEIAEVKILMGSEETIDSMNELLRAAKNGEDFSKSNAFKQVVDAMGLGKQKNKKSKLTVPVENIDGKSIREVLESTLGARPCLAKNLGW